MNFVFLWNRFNNVSELTYQIQISTDSTFATNLVGNTTLFDTSYATTGIKLQTTYYWRVQARVPASVGPPWTTNWNTWRFTTQNTPQVPPLQLITPADQIVQPLVFDGSQPIAVQFLWHHYAPLPGYPIPFYDFQLSTDSTFATGVEVFTGGQFDTTYTSVHIVPNTTYCWRVRADFGLFSSNWSCRAFTTQNYPQTTISQIQTVNAAALNQSDTEQANAPASLQFSPLNNYTVGLTAVCLVAPDALTLQVSTYSPPYLALVACDTVTGANVAPWSSILVVVNSDSSLASAFLGIQQGDVIYVTGVVEEFFIYEGMSNTVLVATSVTKVGSQPVAGVPTVLTTDNFNIGGFTTGSINFSSGEQYEGTIVELQNLTVNSVLSAQLGTVNLIDGAGNMINTLACSQWFSMGSNRYPSSTFITPVPGYHINSIRGVIISETNRYAIAPVYPGDIQYGIQGHRSISGTLFNDLNHDGIMQNGDQPLSGFTVNIDGKVTDSRTTDTNGYYSFTGLDSGKYTISVSAPNPSWLPTSGNQSITLILGAADTAVNLLTGMYVYQATVNGTVFNDYNQSGTQDPGEPGMAGWRVYLNGTRNDSTVTDSAGHYNFFNVLAGNTYISVVPQPGWEQIYPSYFAPYRSASTVPPAVAFSGLDFAVHPIPTRIKLALTVHDRNYIGNKTIFWGNRTGASYGIWGVDPATTNTDFAEGESELPSLEFAAEVGFFDTRFIAPNTAARPHFGEGSWTDMRSFISPAQVDTHLVSILPAYNAGSGYPMTLIWQHTAVESSFSGSVILEDVYGNTTNMKQLDSLVVTDPTISTLYLISQGPNLPVAELPKWHMVSLPRFISNYTLALFPSSVSSAYSYNASRGYAMDSVMSSGVAYWLKCVLDTTTFSLQSGNRILVDTIALSTGWNMTPAIGVPVDVNDLVTVPNNILSTGMVFRFDARYTFVDSLEPWQGYWIKANQPGELIFSSGGGSLQMAKTQSPARRLLDGSQSLAAIAIRDALGNEQSLYIEYAGSSINLSRYELPPVPPAGIFDARYASERNLETVPRGGKGVFPVLVTNAAYPLTISLLSVPNDGKIAFIVKIGDKNLPLTTKSSITLSSPVPQIALQVSSTGEPIPTAFALMQNYPNPFNPITTIQYAMPLKSHVSLKIYDVLGRLVSTLVDDTEDAGYKSVRFNGSNFASGVYMYEMRAGTFVQVKKFTITK
jgi:hypothetical protein